LSASEKREKLIFFLSLSLSLFSPTLYVWKREEEKAFFLDKTLVLLRKSLKFAFFTMIKILELN